MTYIPVTTCTSEVLVFGIQRFTARLDHLTTLQLAMEQLVINKSEQVYLTGNVSVLTRHGSMQVLRNIFVSQFSSTCTSHHDLLEYIKIAFLPRDDTSEISVLLTI